MKVHCYHSPIPNSGAEAIIELWRESWSKFGWTPVVLTDADACKLPFYEALKFKSRMLPTVNDHRYEFACYVRYLAMAGAAGGLLTDYDTLNVGGFKPSDLPPHKGKLMRFNRQCPCMLFGNTWNYLQCVDMFLSYTPQPDDLYGDRMLVQDQTILNKYQHIADWHDLCSEYRADNSNKETLVHFASMAVGGSGKKEAAILEFMKAIGG